MELGLERNSLTLCFKFLNIHNFFGGLSDVELLRLLLEITGLDLGVIVQILDLVL